MIEKVRKYVATLIAYFVPFFKFVTYSRRFGIIKLVIIKCC